MSCHPNCQFVHPSEPSWDRARPSGLRGRGGHPYAPRGRSQGAPGSGANSHPLGSNTSNSWDDYIPGSSSNPATTSSGWGTSSSWDSQAKAETSGWGDKPTSDSGWGVNVKNDAAAAERPLAEHPLGSNTSNSWDDYISGSSSNPATTSSGWGTSSSWDSQAKAETSGWGDKPTSDSGWGVNVKNDAAAAERPFSEPAASDMKSPTSPWGGHSADRGAPGEGWGVSDRWGTADTGLESGWGQDSIPNHWGTTLSETATSKMGSSMVVGPGRSRIEDGIDAAKTADLTPLVVPANSVASQHENKLANQPIRVSTTPSTGDHLPTEHKVLSPTLPRQSPVVNSTNKSYARTRSEGNGRQVTLESLSTDSEMRQVTNPRDIQVFTQP